MIVPLIFIKNPLTGAEAELAEAIDDQKFLFIITVNISSFFGRRFTVKNELHQSLSLSGKGEKVKTL